MQLTTQWLLECYRLGVFPMAEDRHTPLLFLVDPKLRGVLPLERFHVPRRLARTMRGSTLRVRVDAAFPAVIAACAEVGEERNHTWINAEIEGLYCQAHREGFAHSVECWRGEQLVGGLYGIALGGVFFGESMFSRERDASKIALVGLAARLRRGGFRMLDTQFWTEHLAQFGAAEMPRRAFRRRLEEALAVQGTFHALGPEHSPAQLLQEITQTS